ncbi:MULTISPECIES: DUF262 domain-containing protein [Bacillus]|uniref:DUF262 domain-containing protein n=1 Tax=Bacillus TaxID=1386 RepID=UPI000E4F13B9|nr:MULTISPECIES: DUF262 domain-containing protein [Bacillus subtilis group]MBT3123434.1 DUF262 domain-containing protein [Bacillus inaquosorum]MCF7615418.1 DUF262 domain-containing protein [Bacillus subtilis]MCB5337083.1 hypothetical protein [Bacillus amyloliquefaciens]MCB5337387.1 hypothetical protein [Bacillus amyloliquefaciens]QTG87332.1 DUF262 domain-containing protein [Bacillus amyloliquefaciens]
MKFKDIKQYIRSGGYAFDVGLRYLPETINNYINEYGLELNPDFQRGHVWSQDQQVKYLEYLLRGGRSGMDIYLNHPNWHSGGDGWFVCVDGLQRITACLKFINNEIKVFGHYYSQFEDRVPLGFGLRFNINSLKTRAEVLEWYIQLNSGGTIHTEDEINRVRRLLLDEKA